MESLGTLEHRVNKSLSSRTLPISLLGELKYEHDEKVGALTSIYDAVRQCVFYLGAFNGKYHDAVGLIADATPGHVIADTFDQLPSGLKDRFGSRNHIYLKVVRIS